MIIKLKEVIPFKKYKFDNIYHLNKDKLYIVIGIESPYYILINEIGTLSMYPILFFDTIDDSMDEDWVFSIENQDDNPCDIQIFIESKKLKNFDYDKFYNYDSETVNIFINYINSKNIVLSSNLAYCPIRSRRKYYKKLLDKIDNLLVLIH